MSERITDARLRELTAAMPDRMGGTLVDTLLLRELAAEILAARTDDARTLAAEAAARGAQYREREALAVVAVLRARLDARAAADAQAVADAAEAFVRAREGFGAFRAQVRQERAQSDAGDLAGLGRREGRTWTVTAGEGEGR